MMPHRVTYECVGKLVPWWKIAIGLPLELLGIGWRIRRWCLTYRVPALGIVSLGLYLGLGTLALAACDACSGGRVQIQPAPAVQWDGSADESAHACAVLAAAGCPVGKNPACAAALRNDLDNLGAVDLGCILDAGPDAAALRAICNVACR